MSEVHHKITLAEAKSSQTLAESEAQFRHLLEKCPDMLFRISLPQGYYEYVSPASTDIFGYAPGEFKNLSWMLEEIIHPDMRSTVEELWSGIAKGELESSYEYKISHRSGASRWLNQRNTLIFDDKNQAIALEGIITDISERLETDAVLRKSEWELRSILINLQDTYFRINPKGRFAMISESIRDLLGWASVDLIGKKFNELFYDQEGYEKFRQTLDSCDGKISNYSARMVRIDGAVRWISLTCQLTGHTGTNIEGTARDITEQYKMQEQETHNKKMDAIGRLTSSIAHDFGNFMTIAKGNMQLLQESIINQYDISSEIMELLDDTNSAIKDSVELTSQLLTFSRKKTTEPEYLNVSDNIMQFQTLLKNTLGEKISLSINIQQNSPKILVEKAQLESSLLNLVINARDAMPDGGHLEISAVLKPVAREDKSLKAAHTMAKNHLCISITDSGSGMSDDVLNHAIEPFFSTKKDIGTGLGLSVVYRFMQRSRGQLIIDSRPGEGTCITMQFPVLKTKTETKTVLNTQKIFPFGHETILVVEDRPVVRRFAVRCLANHKFNILEAEDATSAMKILKKNKNICLLFTDILMPGKMNGRQLAQWALKQNPRLKVLLTTVQEKQIVHIPPEADQKLTFLQKPYVKEELIEKIYEIL